LQVLCHLEWGVFSNEERRYASNTSTHHSIPCSSNTYVLGHACFSEQQ
jgi:hypothetical protein